MLIFLFVLACLAMAGDVVVTDIAIKNGHKESNPIIVKLFGKYPDTWQLAVVKLPGLAVAGVGAFVYGAWPAPLVLAALHIFLVVRNWRYLK